jgi:hypothetical protein
VKERRKNVCTTTTYLLLLYVISLEEILLHRLYI